MRIVSISIILIFLGCNNINKSNNELIDKDILSNCDSIIVKVDSIKTEDNIEYIIPNHELLFSDTIKHSPDNVIIDTTLSLISKKDTILGYRINPSSKEVLRFFQTRSSKFQPYLINGFYINNQKVLLESKFRYPNEFNGKSIFFNKWEGGDLEGSITKVKYDLQGNNLVCIDSLSGGWYSEGAGTWEWLIGIKGEAIGILNPDDRWFINDDHLLINSVSEYAAQIYLINYIKKDTLTSLDIPDRGTYNILFDGNKIYLQTEGKGRMTYLKAYSQKGVLLWEQNTSFFQKMISDTLNNNIIAHGVYHTGVPNKNSHISYIICYDNKTGERKWDFPTTNIFNGEWFKPTNLFIVSDNLYGVTFYHKTHKKPRRNLLLLFNKEGEVTGTFELSSNYQNSSIIELANNQFDIISNYETTRFQIDP